MSGYLTPMLLTTGVAAANEWYNTGNPIDSIKPLVLGGIATSLLGLFNQIPGMSGACTGIGWIAFVGLMVGNAQTPSPVTNLLKITGQ